MKQCTNCKKGTAYNDADTCVDCEKKIENKKKATHLIEIFGKEKAIICIDMIISVLKNVYVDPPLYTPVMKGDGFLYDVKFEIKNWGKIKKLLT